MGATALRSPASTPASAPVFYTKEFIETYGSDKDALASPQVPTQAAESEQTPPVSEADVKERERLRILAELRADELSAAEAAAQRIGSWAYELQKRTVPCLVEQQEVERCYAAPPGGDQLRCGPAVDAYVRCAKAWGLVVLLSQQGAMLSAQDIGVSDMRYHFLFCRLCASSMLNQASSADKKAKWIKMMLVLIHIHAQMHHHAPFDFMLNC